MKFKIGDLVTFSDKCPKDLQKAFARGPREITAVAVGWYGLYEVGKWCFDAKDLKNAKATPNQQ